MLPSRGLIMNVLQVGVVVGQLPIQVAAVSLLHLPGHFFLRHEELAYVLLVPLLERAEVSDLIHHRQHSAGELAEFLCLVLRVRGLLFEFAQTGLVSVIIECEKLVLVGILEGN